MLSNVVVGRIYTVYCPYAQKGDMVVFVGINIQQDAEKYLFCDVEGYEQVVDTKKIVASAQECYVPQALLEAFQRVLYAYTHTNVQGYKYVSRHTAKINLCRVYDAWRKKLARAIPQTTLTNIEWLKMQRPCLSICGRNYPVFKSFNDIQAVDAIRIQVTYMCPIHSVDYTTLDCIQYTGTNYIVDCNKLSYKQLLEQCYIDELDKAAVIQKPLTQYIVCTQSDAVLVYWQKHIISV